MAAVENVQVEILREKKEAENVIGVRPGKDPALSKETIVVGAHMDHLGYGEVGGSLAESAVGKEIHNGADDNASGTAANLFRFLVEAGIPRTPDFNGAQQEGCGYYQTTTSDRRRWSESAASVWARWPAHACR